MGRRREKEWVFPYLNWFHSTFSGVPIFQCRSCYLQELPSEMHVFLRLRQDPYTADGDRDVLGSGTVQTTGQTKGSHEEILDTVQWRLWEFMKRYDSTENSSLSPWYLLEMLRTQKQQRRCNLPENCSIAVSRFRLVRFQYWCQAQRAWRLRAQYSCRWLLVTRKSYSIPP